MAIELGDFEAWAVTYGVLFVLLVALESFMYAANRCGFGNAGITLDVLENLKSIDRAKDTIRNIYTNVSLVSALLLTIACSMLFLTQDMPLKTQPIMVHAYVATTAFAVIQLLWATVECVGHLVYTEALSSPDTIRYVISWTGSIGGPINHLMWGLASLCLGAVQWTLAVHSVAAAAGVASMSGFFFTWLTFTGVRRWSSFTTDRQKKASSKWTWAESEEGPCPLKFASARQISILRQRAKEALEFEKQTKVLEPHDAEKDGLPDIFVVAPGTPSCQGRDACKVGDISPSIGKDNMV